MNTDLIIIGAGPGGYETAVRAAKAGLQVVIIEKEHLGGTCLNAGCIPTKCLCHSAEGPTPNPASVGRGEDAEALLDEANVYLAEAIARKNEVVEKLKAGVAQLMKTPGITLVEGEARFLDSHTVAVKATDNEFSAPNIIIATGSQTKFLPIPGAHAEGVVTSTEMLNLTTLPQRLCIIGGGVIGLEFASIFQSLGSQVTVIEFCKEVLPNFDRDLAKRLRTSLKKRGIEFHTSAAAKEISPLPASPCREGEDTIHPLRGGVKGRLQVDFEEKGKLQSVEADLVLMAVGRAANLQSLNLADVGIETTPRGIVVDEHMQTNVPGIYAIGDVNGLMQLAHAASAQGKIALDHILNSSCGGWQGAVIPSAVFTVPEAAMVGQTEEQLEEAGTEYQAHKALYRANGKALAMEAEDGLVKILTDKDGKILGCHILGAHASDLIHEATLAMRLGATIHDLADTVHAHPSLSEILLAAAEA
ncbi:MAG: dihydrolipoyl dehydrogenase [Bacteroidaceae bacterium]|nr:dihydrolipoyl dehydrogenase [Bacteroidaceae bacterium]